MKKLLLSLCLSTIWLNGMAQWEGEGTQANPYKISDNQDLITLSDKAQAGEKYQGKYFKVTASELNFLFISKDESGSNFTPIASFSGNFDGNGVTIRNMVISGSDNIGLFGYLGDGAQVKGITFAASCGFTGRIYVGSVVGECSGLVCVDNCTNHAPVTGGSFVGGIVGGGTLRRISKCANYGTVTGVKHNEIAKGNGSYVGGIVGRVDPGLLWLSLESNLNRGEVSADGSNVGGICGYTKMVSMKYNQNLANVSGSLLSVGALVGALVTPYEVNFENYYYHNVVVTTGSEVYRGTTPRAAHIMWGKAAWVYDDMAGFCLKRGFHSLSVSIGKWQYGGCGGDEPRVTPEPDDNTHTYILTFKNCQIELQAVDNMIIPAGQVVLVQTSINDNIALPCTSDDPTGDLSSNILQMVTTPTESSTFSGTVYVLEGDNNQGILFKRFTGTLTPEMLFFVADCDAGEFVVVEGNNTSATLTFTDNNVETICLNKWDTDGDGVLSKTEAAAVTSLGDVFKQKGITAFDELKYFTGLTEIGEPAFYGCSNLTSVTLPNTVTSLARWVFYATGLTKLEIPASVTNIATRALIVTPNMEAITVDADNASYQSIDGVLYTKDGKTLVSYPNKKGATYAVAEGTTTIGELAFYGEDVEEVILPSTLTTIGLMAFQGCNSLKKVEIPDAVTSVGDWAFGYSGIKVAHIGAGLTEIPSDCFNSCDQLEHVYVKSTTPATIQSDAFSSDTYKKATLHVPAGTLSAYQAAEGWKDFMTIMEVSDANNIAFADSKVKALCVANWDTNGDGELSEEEAAAVTSLGQVFQGEKDIVSLNELQYFTGLTEIGAGNFYGCSALKSIILPASITSIGGAAFRESGITSIVIPNQVTTIERAAFASCTQLATVNLGTGLTTLGPSVFAGCTSLKSLTLPASLTSIDSEFMANSNIEELIFDADAPITAIPANMFEFCHNLKKVVLPNAIKSIGKEAFFNCDNLESITLPENLESIGGSAFQACSKLEALIMPDKLTTIGENAFYGCDGLKRIKVSAALTEIPTSMFSRLKKLETVTFGENSVLATIGSGAFSSCSKLTSITLPQSLKTIGEFAFSDCNLSSFVMPDAVTSIGKEILAGNDNLHTLQISAGVTALPDYAFFQLEGLKTVTFGDNAQLTTIGARAFENCGNLETFIMPDKVASFPHDIFTSCDNLKTLKLSAALTEIPEQMFWRCELLETVTFGDNAVLESIGGSAFYRCIKLKTFGMPATVKTIGKDAFKDCSVLEDFEWSSALESIGESAFSGCGSLKTITLPATLTAIGDKAFWFAAGLKDVYADMATPPTITYDTFEGYEGDDYTNSIYKKATLHVPAASKALYQAATGWKEFSNIQTGINAVTVSDQPATIYTLDGRKITDGIESLPKGIYIIGGKKTIINKQ